MMKKKIVQLSDDVVAKIAAGEVVHRPVNVVKEMIENSLDAGATCIRVSTREGGLKYILVEDNGCGISAEDLPLLCERHCTSKLSDFSELKGVQTFGFRGEAMASVSHVAHVTVTSLPPDAPCAFEAKYLEGRMVGQAKPKAGRPGTSITIEDLFYNVATRRKALCKYPRDEFKRITRLIRCYSLCYPNVSWMVKEMEGSGADVVTPGDQSIYQVASCVFGKQLGVEVLPISLDLMQEFDASVDGFITNGHYNGSKTEIVTFVNGRLVESKSLRNSINSAFKKIFCGEAKVHPLVFLQLRVAPEHVDVNVDPNKRFVHFLNEQLIADRVHSRIVVTLQAWKQPLKSLKESQVVATATKKSATKATAAPTHTDDVKRRKKEVAAPAKKKRKLKPVAAPPVVVNEEVDDLVMASQPCDDHPVLVALRANILESESHTCSSVVKSFCSIFSVSPEMCLAETKHQEIFLVDTFALCRELCFQYCVHNAPNFHNYSLRTPLSLRSLLIIALGSKRSGFSPEDGNVGDIAEQVTTFLVDKAPILSQVAGIELDDHGMIKQLPLSPLDRLSFEGLPLFFMQLAYDVEWSSENETVVGVIRQLSSWMAPDPSIFGPFPVEFRGGNPVAQRIYFSSDNVDDAFKLASLYTDSYVWAERGRSGVFVQGIGAFFASADTTEQFVQVVHPSRPCRFLALFDGSDKVLQRLFAHVENHWRNTGGLLSAAAGSFRYRRIGDTYLCVSDSLVFHDICDLGAFLSSMAPLEGSHHFQEGVQYMANSRFPLVSSDFHPHYRVKEGHLRQRKNPVGNYERGSKLVSEWLTFASSWAPFKAPRSFLDGVLTKVLVEQLNELDKGCISQIGN